MPTGRSSRQRFEKFREAYRLRRLDDEIDIKDEKPQNGVKRRQHIREYLRWLKPHRVAVASVFFLALIVAGLQMVEPLFMRFMIDKVLLNNALTQTDRPAPTARN